MTTPAPLVDQFQRTITYLRLSVTDRCDLRCAYCMPERMTFLPKKDVLTLDEMHDLALGFIARGISRIRLTGGEPLVRRDMIELVQALGRKIGVDDGAGRLEELTLTTNGTRLAEFADDLFGAGVRRINVSLDTLDRERFARLTRRDSLPQVLEGLAAAKAAGLKVKLNTVALRGENEHEIADLVAWAHGQGFEATLIEVMPLGEVEGDRIDHYLQLVAVQDDLARRWTLTPSGHRTGGPARYWDVAETGGRLGLITPLTNNFCEGCNRIRVTATGQLYACLGGSEQVDLRAALRSDSPGSALNAGLDLAMRIKPARHSFAIDERGAAPAAAPHVNDGRLMMAANPVFLGRLEELAGRGACAMALDAPLDWASLLARLGVDHVPQLAEIVATDRVRVALNGALVADKQALVLADGDEIAFLPPVSGG